LPTLRFFDCNARIGRSSVPRPEHILEPADLLAEMDRAGVERALVTHAWSLEWDPVKGNEELLRVTAGEPRLRPCLAGLPAATRELPPPPEFAQAVSAAGGTVRLFPNEHQYVLDQVSCGSLLQALGENHVPVLIDVGQVGWTELAGLLDRHPAVNFVLLNVYYRVDRYLYPLLDRFGNLHVESGSYGVHRGVEAVCERFGAERLVFGTDLPVHEVGGPIALVTYAAISDEEKQLIAAGNLERLLGEVK